MINIGFFGRNDLPAHINKLLIFANYVLDKIQMKNNKGNVVNGFECVHPTSFIIRINVIWKGQI